jgi:RNA polymerase sigma factor (sigma-70 family)
MRPEPLREHREPQDHDSARGAGSPSRLGDWTKAELERVIARDREAARRFVRDIGDWLCGILRSSCYGRIERQEEDDFRQDLMEELVRNDYRKLREWDPLKGACLSTWIGRIVYYRMQDHGRCYRRLPVLLQDRELDAIGGRTAGAGFLPWLEAKESMEEFLRECDEIDRVIFEERLLQQKDVAEVAEKLGATKDAVYQRECRLRKRLGALLQVKLTGARKKP